MTKFQVYIITNDTNDKVYIGQTTQTLHDRFYSHLNNPANPMSKIMNEIGEEHFKISLLDDTASNLDELLEKEKYYVKKYNSIENGYNQSIPTRTNGKTHHTIRFSSSVDKKLYEELKAYSEESGIPISKLLDKAIAAYLESVKRV